MKHPFSALPLATAAIIAMVSPLSVQGDAPPPVGGNLTWCTTQSSGQCTLGIRQNFDTNEIDAYIFEHNCALLNSTNEILTESNYTFTWPGIGEYRQTGYIYVQGITGGENEFWFDGTLYQSGWSWEDPLPIYYEFLSFECHI